MRINTNVDAMRAYSNYATWNAAKSKSLLRISSGKRINSFADDPAGACIAVKMGVQVSGLKVAKRNAQDGISLIQTAEGALNETHSILGRMRDLAVQAANGTLTYEDRAAIDKEFQALRQEIDRIGNSSQFNTINLLDGSRNKITLQVGANAGQTMDVELSDMRFDAIFKTTNGKLSVTDANGQTVDVEMGLCGSRETIKNITMQKMHIMRQPTVWLWPRPKDKILLLWNKKLPQRKLPLKRWVKILIVKDKIMRRSS